MAPIKIERVVSVSSEDEAHPAANLLKTDYSNKKWKSKTIGEKKISVVLQLAESSKITSIDVGNEHTAFIEILVGKSCSTDDDFKVLLVSSSLMSLQEAKSSTNVNGVNFFKEEKLCKPVYEEKWDRVKIICTQPFNKHVQFGLSFIVFQTDVSICKNPPRLGVFQLKNDDDVSTLLRAGGLFANRNKLNQQSASGAAAIRAASTSGKPNLNGKNIVDVPVASAVVPKASLDKQKKQVTPKGNAKDSDKRKKVANGNPPDYTPSKNTNGPTTSPAKKVVRASVQVYKRREERPFCNLMTGVIFVISGFQNPLRSELRNKALAMGAKYEANWNCSCTHLICAFANTPKYNEVRGQGKIVKKEWIEDCYSRRMRLPWRRYALDRTDAAQAESEEEIYEEIVRATPAKRTASDRHSSEEDTDDEIERVRQKQKKLNHNKVNNKKVEKETKLDATPSTSSAAQQFNDISTDDDEMPQAVIFAKPAGKPDDSPLPSTSTSHQLDELNADHGDGNNLSNREQLSGKKNKQKKFKELSIYDVDTESEDEDKQVNGDPEELPCYFCGTTLALLDDLSVQDRALLTRYIKAHQGKVADKDTDLNTVLYAITKDSSAIDRIKEDFPQVIGIKPEWVFRSHDESKLLPASSFKI